MSYGNRSGGKGSGSSVRLTGFFPTKRRGLFVGGMKQEQLQGLIDLLKQAYEQKKGLTFFLWQQGRGEGPEFAVTADLERERDDRGSSGYGGRSGGGPRRRIEQDDDAPFQRETEEPAPGAKRDFPW